MTTLVAALSLHQAGHATAAAAAYSQILVHEPNNTDALYLLGILARQAQRPGEAIELIQRAIALKGGVAQFHNHLGEAFLDIGDAERGRSAFLRALQLRPRYVEAMLNLAAALIAVGKDSEAAVWYAALLRLCPSRGDVADRLKGLSRRWRGKRLLLPAHAGAR
jgi:Flp pilus assembly protein TadD